MMQVPFSGGCACQAVRYSCAEDPFVSYLCHCTECRKRTGSAFGMSVQVPSAGFRLDAGEPRVRTRVADSGNELAVRFCGVCGTSVWSTSAARPHVTVVYAGTLDEPGRVPVLAHIWTDGALPWVAMDPGIERFPKAPDFARYYAGR